MPKKPSKKSKKQRRPISRKKELAIGLLLVIAIAVALRIFLFFPTKVGDEGMSSGLYAGDFLLCSQIPYKTGTPQPGDLIAFEHPFKVGEKVVRRVIATEGQTIEIVGKMVYVNGEPLAEFPAVQHSDYRILPRDFSNRDYFEAKQVPAGHLFVLGDNRDNAEDSRHFGFVDVQKIDGKGIFVYFSYEPDPNAPKMKSPYIIPAIQIFFYNLFHFPARTRWDRFFASS
ncbi:MAG: signal peptidase I [Candidatus Zixiibacteriota bacterium]|nr:MAG: signal peptidase I [candidate division Zixibacteria bacterium]